MATHSPVRDLAVTLAAFCAIAGIPSLSQAAILDSFNSPHVVGLSGPGFRQSFVNDAQVIGGQREIGVLSTGQFSSPSVGVGNGAFHYTSMTGSVSGTNFGGAVYDGLLETSFFNTAQNGLGSLDLTADGSNAFKLSFLYSLGAASYFFGVQDAFGVTDGPGIISPIPITTSPDPFDIILPFSLFSGPSFTQIGAVMFSLHGNNVSVALDEISTTNLDTPPAIPEPGSLPLLGIGLAGAGLLRRRADTRNGKRARVTDPGPHALR